MDWKGLNDPENIENGNAGNGGDLVKHTVYLATLQFLLRQPPWCQNLRLRECHAGRGMYHISSERGQHKPLSALYSTPAARDSILLHHAQREILGRLGCWPDACATIRWYAGSAILNAFALGENNPTAHELDAYEALPATRQILRAILRDPQLCVPRLTRVLPLDERNEMFDGEAYVAESIAGWHKQDVIMLDPFAMWRQASDQLKRDRYRAIVNGLVCRNDAPSCIIFWTWGRAFPIATGDLNGTSQHVVNGYQDLRVALHAAGRQIVLVKWRWALQFAMWIVVPTEHLIPLHQEIRFHCDRLAEHLTRHGYCPANPRVTVTID